MEGGQTGRDRDQVAHEEREQHARGAQERERARGAEGQRDDEGGERERRGGEPEAGAHALVEVIRHERAVDPRADGTGEDHHVAPEVELDHLTTTVPVMSWLWSVQT